MRKLDIEKVTKEREEEEMVAKGNMNKFSWSKKVEKITDFSYRKNKKGLKER